MVKNSNRGLAIIYDPHNLYQFVWYYCNNGNGKKWDALCLPNDSAGEYMHSYCEAAGIFETIYFDSVAYSQLKASSKIKILIEMLWYFITGRVRDYCKKIINEYVVLDNYSEIVIIAEVGVVSGACAYLGDEKEVIILEDGTNDYEKRLRFIPIRQLNSSKYWQGFFLSKMGYCNPGWFYLKSSNKCIKYCSSLEKMKYHGYREMRRLFDENGTNMELFRKIVLRIFPQIENYTLDNVEAVLISRPLDDFVNDSSEYRKRVQDFLNRKYKSVLIKRHPRENSNFMFDESVRVIEVDRNIPVEILFPFFIKKDVYVLTPSATMMYMRAFGLKAKCFYIEDMYRENLHTNSRDRTLSYEETIGYCNKFMGDLCEIVSI